MKYRVKLTNNGLRQLKEAVGYIAGVLLAPETARQWSDRIRTKIVSLGAMPRRYPLVEEEPWHTEGIRKMTVENFIVYYWVNEDTAVVWVTAVVYARRDQISALRRMPKE